MSDTISRRHGISRRDAFRWCTGAVSTFVFLRPQAFAQESGGSGASEESSANVQRKRRASDAGLAWLTEHQRGDGSFEGVSYGADPAIVALAGRAFLAAGSVPGRGVQGEPLKRCVDYILAHAEENGYLHVRRDGHSSTMYSHGYALAFLAASYRASMNETLRTTIERAVALLVESQSDEGGWRYVPKKIAGADVSVTSCQLLALCEAKASGVDVPEATIDAAVGYLTECQNADGGFRYVRGSAASSAVPRSAAALAALTAAERSMHDVVRRGREYLDRLHEPPGENWRQAHFFYTAYFAVQAMCREANEERGRWRDLLTEALLDAHRVDGAWQDPVGAPYATAVACYVLNYPLPGE